jgi:hypothetical protein
MNQNGPFQNETIRSPSTALKHPASPLMATDPRPARVAAVGAEKIPIKDEIV